MQTAMNLTFRFLVCRDGNAALQFLLHAVNCVRFCFWHCDFFVCVWNIPGTAERICAKFTQKTCLVPHSHEFEGQGHQGQKTAFFGPFSGLHAAYVWWNIFSLLFFFKFCSYLTGSLTQSYRWHYASIQCKKIRVTVTWTTTGYNSLRWALFHRSRSSGLADEPAAACADLRPFQDSEDHVDELCLQHHTACCTNGRFEHSPIPDLAFNSMVHTQPNTKPTRRRASTSTHWLFAVGAMRMCSA